jgi:hypothetical protein
MIRIPIDHVGRYRVEVLEWSSPDPGVKAAFSRWQDNAYKPVRVIEYHIGKHYQAGFELSYLVNQEFTDLSGAPVDPQLVTDFTLKSSMGGRLTFTDTAPRWLQGGRVVKRKQGLEETLLYYSVESVMVDGSSVVNRAQHRFFPADVREWTIPLLFYSARFTSKDAIFGFPVGEAVQIVAPDGEITLVPLEPDGTATVPSLPRGTYQVNIQGGGYSPLAPVALSRNQEVALEVISPLDLAFVGGLGFIVVTGLLFIGRRQLVFFPFYAVRWLWRSVVGGRIRRVTS